MSSSNALVASASVLFAGVAMACSAALPPPDPHPPLACQRLAAQLFTLAPALDDADEVVLARVHGCDVELLSSCTAGAVYAAILESPKPIPRFLVANEAEARSTFPLELGKVQPDSPGPLTVSAEVTSEVAANPAPPAVRGDQACASATHYVERLSRGTLSIQGGSNPVERQGVIAFTLAPLVQAPQTCPDGTVWDGRTCTAPVLVDGCPLGTRATDTGRCAPLPIPWPAETPRLAELKLSLASSDLRQRVNALQALQAELAGDKTSRAIVLATLVNDPGIEESCREPESRKKSSREGAPLRANLLGASPYVPGGLVLAVPDYCDTVAELLASYAELLQQARQVEAAAEVNLRLVREHPVSPSSAPAFKNAAEKLCRDGDVDEANRLYRFIREKFPKTATAASLPADGCEPAARDSPQPEQKKGEASAP
jgi:hypothetical protein